MPEVVALGLLSEPTAVGASSILRVELAKSEFIKPWWRYRNGKTIQRY